MARSTPTHTIDITASGTSDEETLPIVKHDHLAELPSAAIGARWGRSFHSLDLFSMNPEWTSRGKTIAQLIEELRSFEDQRLEVRISLDAGFTSYPISLVAKRNGKYAILENSQDEPTAIQHDATPQ